MVAMRAARPEADEARPAAVGKLFSEAMCRGYAVNLGSEASRDWGRIHLGGLVSLSRSRKGTGGASPRGLCASA